MNYIHSDLGYQHSGTFAEVALQGNAANVLLMDSANLSRYEAGSSFNYFGGYFDRSPATIGIPHAGHWHVVVDLGGGGGHVEASVRVVG